MKKITITFKCDICGQELTFYKDSFAWEGCSCPICDPLGDKPIFKATVKTQLLGERAVLKTRKLFEKQNKNSTKISLEDILKS